MSLAQAIYWKLPYPLKCWATGYFARKHDRARFGADYERAKREIAARNGWSLERFRQYQLTRLQELVRHCADHVPYYRELFRSIGLEPGDIRDFADFQAIPILEKQILRERGEELVDERRDRKGMLLAQTSGTTGTPLQFYRDIREFSTAFAFSAVRLWSAVGVERRVHRSASIGGSLVTAPAARRPPFWVYNRGWQQLVMSSYHLSTSNLSAYIQALRDFEPAYLEGYPSSLYALAQYILDQELPPVPLRGAFTTAENLLDHQRQAISQAFECSVFSQYGCAEQVVFGAECDRQTMHLSPDHSFVEVVGSGGRPLPPGQSGELVGTGLNRLAQPMLRYRLGDIGALAEDGRRCACGSELPVLAEIEGRKDDLLVTADGRSIGRLDPVFKSISNTAEAQIVQESLRDFCIRIVPTASYRPESGQLALQNLQVRLGPTARVRVEVVPAIERTASGKFRAVICQLSTNEKVAATN
jgi:phenylacetate-CoA ligase